jgi:GntR family transcriptional regulator
MFHIDQQSRVPIYEQLFRQVLSLAASGLLEENQQMPSVRQLASDLGINPNTVQKAYRELEREGLIYSVPGRGSFLTSTDIHERHFAEELQEKLQEAIELALKSGFSEDDIRKIFERALDKAAEQLAAQGFPASLTDEQETHESAEPEAKSTNSNSAV